MRRKYSKKLSHLYGYPGDGYYYVACDVCGKKIRAKNAILITDKYNTLKNLVVCPEDADKTNPQQYLKARKETQIENKKLIRSEGADKFGFIHTASEIEGGDTSNPTGQSPGEPKYLATIGATDSQVELQWLGPDDPGSGAISGYKIERESPVGGGFSTIKADTNSVATYYKDTTVSSGTTYNYRVSAINRIGTGNPSNEADITTG